MLRRINPNHRLSQAVVANGFVFISGQGSDDPAKDVEGQAEEVFGRIDALLAEAGTSKDRIVLADIALADIKDYGAINRVWDAWVDKSAPPARTCSEKRVSAKPYLVEVSVVAVV